MKRQRKGRVVDGWISSTEGTGPVWYKSKKQPSAEHWTTDHVVWTLTTYILRSSMTTLTVSRTCILLPIADRMKTSSPRQPSPWWPSPTTLLPLLQPETKCNKDTWFVAHIFITFLSEPSEYDSSVWHTKSSSASQRLFPVTSRKWWLTKSTSASRRATNVVITCKPHDYFIHLCYTSVKKKLLVSDSKLQNNAMAICLT